MRSETTKWLPVALRVVLVVLLAPPAFAKFLAYGEQVEGFAGYGIPAPGVMVIVVGVFEVLAVLAALVGAAGRLAAVPLPVIMVVAMVSAGVVANNVAVLVCAVGIVVLGTGALSVWKPEEKLVGPR